MGIEEPVMVAWDLGRISLILGFAINYRFSETCVRPWILYTPKRRWCEKFIFWNLNVLFFVGGPPNCA